MRFSDYETFLRPIHLQGKRIRVTIQRVEEILTHPRPGRKERALCVFFEGKSKPLILSTANRRFLMDSFGDDVNGCIGQSVALEAKEIRVAGVAKTVIGFFKVQSTPSEALSKAPTAERVN